MPNQVILTGFNEFKTKLRNLPVGVKKEIDYEVLDAARRWERGAKREAPKDQGRLANEIRAKKVRDMEAEIDANISYAPYMEWGTKTKVRVPSDLMAYASQFRGKGAGGDAKKMIYDWCRRVGVPEERWWPVYRAIMQYGVKPQPFFFKQRRLIEPVLIKNIQLILNTEH